MGRSQALVSVVTPFYNTADYLAECIESVLAQTYEHFEYILLDNQSTDGSAEIARRYAEQDSRIRLLRNDDFLNQVQNYNRGLSHIAPESTYTKVVEADNWIYPECLAQMVALADRHPRVGVVGAYSLTETQLRFAGVRQAINVLPGTEAIRMHYLEDAYLFGAPTTVLMRSAAVRERKPFFDESTWLVEDLSAFYEILRDWEFGFVHQVLTFVRTENDGSIQSGWRGYDTMALDRLAVLAKHGEHFLSPGEFRHVLRRTEREYYSRLAHGVLRRKASGFWEYHTEGLATFGHKLSYSRLTGHVALEILRAVANPGSTMMRFVRKLRGVSATN